MVASVRHFGYSQSSGLAPGCVCRFQIASFSPSTLENSVFKKHRFQIAPLWRAFSNGSVFGDCFRRCSVDDSRIRSKTAPFLFENGLVWTHFSPEGICGKGKCRAAGKISFMSRQETATSHKTLGTKEQIQTTGRKNHLFPLQCKSLLQNVSYTAKSARAILE